MLKLISSTLNTKFVNQWNKKMCLMAYEAVKCVSQVVNGKREIDIKRYARVERVNPSLSSHHLLLL